MTRSYLHFLFCFSNVQFSFWISLWTPMCLTECEVNRHFRTKAAVRNGRMNKDTEKKFVSTYIWKPVGFFCWFIGAYFTLTGIINNDFSCEIKDDMLLMGLLGDTLQRQLSLWHTHFHDIAHYVHPFPCWSAGLLSYHFLFFPIMNNIWHTSASLRHPCFSAAEMTC